MIRAGLAILTEKGFSAVGIDEILTTAAVPKGSFYHYFGSKDALGLTLIEAYNEYFLAKLDRWFDDDSIASPLGRLRAFTVDARDGMGRYEYRRGCLIGNLGQEMGTLPEDYRERLIDVMRQWEARTARCLRAAQAAGEVDASADCDALAEYFWIGWEGAVLRAKLERSPDPLDHFAEKFLGSVATEPPGA